MSKVPSRPASLTEYLRRLGNPYAKLQVVAETDLEFRSMTEAERAYVRQLENQYASLSVALKDEQLVVTKQPGAPQMKARRQELSKEGFRSTCRRVFGHYVPQLHKGQLRKHHREFIARNEVRSPMERYELARHLEKYDLSDVPGIEARFNRERDEITEEKLKQIERAVFGSKE